MSRATAGGDELTIAVIGRAHDTAAARAWPGHEVLPAHGWTLAHNLAFIRDIVARRRPVYLASPIRRANLVAADGALTMFAHELALLWHAGFTRSGDWLLPPDPFARALAAAPVEVYQRLRQRARGGDPGLPELAPTLALLGALRPQLGGEARALVAAGVPYGAALALAHDFVRAADAEARAARPDLPVVFVPKVERELLPLVALFPDVIMFPTLAPLDIDFFVATRPVPVHPLGVVAAPLFSDGMMMSPREYFLHDVDHARFLVREELLARGVALPDAYQSRDGGPPTTLIDARLDLHRTILDGAADKVAAAQLGDGARLAERACLAATLQAARATLPGPEAQAVALVLFEILHEKGFPLAAAVLRRELAGAQHTRKIGHKLDSGFWGERLQLDDAARARLDWARSWLGART
jgi:hypothetical protein